MVSKLWPGSLFFRRVFPLLNKNLASSLVYAFIQTSQSRHLHQASSQSFWKNHTDLMGNKHRQTQKRESCKLQQWWSLLYDDNAKYRSGFNLFMLATTQSFSRKDDAIEGGHWRCLALNLNCRYGWVEFWISSFYFCRKISLKERYGEVLWKCMYLSLHINVIL